MKEERVLQATATERVRERLFVALADLHNLAGRTSFDTGMLDPARNHFARALEFAKYGENNSLMAITRNYSTAVLVAAGVIAMALGFFSKLAALVATIPEFVTGGLAIYLFGVIGMQGIALMMAERVNLFDPRQLAIGAVILVIGIGGNAFEGGNIPVGGMRLPAIATAAVAGILLNLLFLALDGRRAGGRGPAGAPSRPAPASAGDD